MYNNAKLLFIVNPVAGHGVGATIIPKLKNFFSESGQEVHIEQTQSRGEATEIAAKASHEGVTTIVAVGGDGTINEVASGIFGTQSALGIVPVGSGNGLARHYNIPMNSVKALDVIARNNQTNHDAIKINDKLSFNISGIGFDAHVANLFGKNGKRGLSGYASIILKEYFSYPGVNILLNVNGQSAKYSAFLIAIACTSQFGNNACIAPKAIPNDGFTDITILKKIPLIKLMPFAWMLFNKKIGNSGYINMLKGQSMMIESEAEMPLHIDGDPAGYHKKISIETIKGAIKLIVP